METRAYHLQYSAHRAVALAIKSGKLIRQPCEECGAEGQAHHDSYYPDRWLSVRWLCRAHHRAWHEKNEPDWPSIYEFHPSDSPGYWTESEGGVSKTRGVGRPPRPWFRTDRAQWCVTFRGKRYDLGPDYEQALTRFQGIQKAAE